MNRKKFLNLGYHAVKCRGQKQLDDGVSIEAGRNAEERFFQTHPIWSTVDQTKVGVNRLSMKLVTLLEEIVQSGMPAVLKEIDIKLQAAQAEMYALGTSLDNATARRFHYTTLVENYFDIMFSAIKGTYTGPNVAGFFFNEDKSLQTNFLRARFKQFDVVYRDKISKFNLTQKSRERSQSEVIVGEKIAFSATIKERYYPRIVGMVTKVFSTSISVDYSSSSYNIPNDSWKFLEANQSVNDLTWLKDKISVLLYYLF
jgi:Dynamin central region